MRKTKENQYRDVVLKCDLTEKKEFDNFKPDFLLKYGFSREVIQIVESRVRSDFQTTLSW